MSVSTLLSLLVGLKEEDGWMSVHMQIHASVHTVTVGSLYMHRRCQTLKYKSDHDDRLA